VDCVGASESVFYRHGVSLYVLVVRLFVICLFVIIETGWKSKVRRQLQITRQKLLMLKRWEFLLAKSILALVYNVFIVGYSMYICQHNSLNDAYETVCIYSRIS